MNKIKLVVLRTDSHWALASGVLWRGLNVQVCTTDETCRYVRVGELFVYEKFSRVAAQAVEAGDICAVCGIDDIQIGETIADKISGKPLPTIKVEEPTVKMAFSINTSPFVGRENISPGMKLWGVIAEVNEKDIIISLPGGLRGLVRASEAFDPISDNKVKDVETNFLSSIYHVGQLVSCIVLQLGDDKKEKGKRRIWLSLRLALLHKTLTLDVIQEGMVCIFSNVSLKI
ncbi:hypothetical protein LOK49_LG05G02266 [Camellia lanceoleosa]|uniref:Uncharacterized protein n=1 Tax=Camellia lanceoleosa TaxID=1840588 RepID=A0ACC0HNI0_9ERIC|nr:hypothetical protein LOK49_LG05G02266 [Camellia lanceoleosa]